ncbi:MAG: MBL fold metallo-hydrolase [Vicinamibacterales bacterium]
MSRATRSLPAPTIVNVGYRSTNFWVVSAGTSRLLVDLGWPGTAAALLANLARAGIPMREVGHGFATHYHIDHAGAAEDLKARGMRLVLTPEQAPFVDAMARWTKPADRYTPITPAGNVVVAIGESREFLRGLGIPGELVHTPGHSADSVSLLLDTGAVFTGDLPRPSLAASDDERAAVVDSWRALKDRGAITVYGGHGPVGPLPGEA